MTLGQLLSLYQRISGDIGPIASPSASDPFTAQQNIQDACDMFAQESDAYWANFTEFTVDAVDINPTGIIKETICAPPLYKMRSFNYYDGQQCWYPMLPKTIPEMDGAYRWPSWRSYQPTYNYASRIAVVEGQNIIRLWPRPQLATPELEVVEIGGYGLPSKDVKPDGTPKFSKLDDECPLNACCHPGLVYRAIKLRAMQFPTPENVMRARMADEQEKTYLGQLIAFALNVTPPYRYDQRVRYGGYGGQ